MRALLSHRPLRPRLRCHTHIISGAILARTSSTSSANETPAQPEFAKHEEPLHNYRPGGYHPTNLGDTLNGRYHIRCKLGCGTYSTVWLARDKEIDKHFSIKILTDRASNSHKISELSYLQHVAKYDPSHPGYSRVVRLLDHFYHFGPHGSHLCLVTEVLAESVQSLASYTNNNVVNPAVAKGITKQVLQGLDYLHKSGIVHTDLKLDNILVELPDMESYIRRALESFSIEALPPVENAAGMFINYVPSTPLAIPLEDVKSYRPVNVKIADLGVACWVTKIDEYPSEIIQSPAIRAPEVFVGAGWDSKCDIWSVGCLVFEMLTGKTPTPAEQMESLGARILFLVCLFGPFPQELVSRGKYANRYFKPDGSFLFDVPEAKLVPRYTAYIIRYKGFLQPDEVERLISFLDAAFALLPEKRPTAAELLEYDWINSETVMPDLSEETEDTSAS